MPVPPPCGFWPEMIRCPQMSSMRYHQPTHHMLLTSRQPDTHCSIYLFSPLQSEPDDGSRPHWMLGQSSYYKRISMGQRDSSGWQSNACTPAPAASSLLCVVATNAGILRVTTSEESAWLAPPRVRSRLAHRPAASSPLELLDVDFQHGHPNVLFAGGRKPLLWAVDMRAPEADWAAARLVAPRASSPLSVAHLRSLNPFHVLVAGPCHAMATYDIRALCAPSSAAHLRPANPPSAHPLAHPLVTFPQYRNAAHIHTGWDVSPDLGVVAAAHDDASVGLFSLRTGRLLHSPAAIPSAQLHAPVRAMHFQRMPTERLPSLFVAEGPSLHKYSFGAYNLDDEA